MAVDGKDRPTGAHHGARVEKPVSMEISTEACEANYDAYREALKLTKTQRQAIEELAVILDPARVDAVLQLPAGTVERWFREANGFREMALDARWKNQQEAVPLIDYGGVLTPRQRNAARLLAEGVTQKESAEQVGVDPRSIYNWKLDPAFEKFIRQLQDRAAFARRAQREEEDEELHARVRELDSLAAAVIKEKLLAGDERSAQIILKSLMEDQRAGTKRNKPA